MEHKKLPKMTLNVIKNVLSRAELKNIMAGSTGEGCLARWVTCSWVTEETDCCGSGVCTDYNGRIQCV